MIYFSKCKLLSLELTSRSCEGSLNFILQSYVSNIKTHLDYRYCAPVNSKPLYLTPTLSSSKCKELAIPKGIRWVYCPKRNAASYQPRVINYFRFVSCKYHARIESFFNITRSFSGFFSQSAISLSADDRRKSFLYFKI